MSDRQDLRSAWDHARAPDLTNQRLPPEEIERRRVEQSRADNARRRSIARSPEAEAQIAAAREPPSDMEVAIQQVDEQEREMQEQTRRWAGARKGLNDEQRAALDTREAIEKQQRDRVDSLASSADRTTDWIGETRAMTARMGALQSERRILTTNHPEVTDPAERERLGLGPLAIDGPPRCCGWLIADGVACPVCGATRTRDAAAPSVRMYRCPTHGDFADARETRTGLVTCGREVGSLGGRCGEPSRAVDPTEDAARRADAAAAKADAAVGAFMIDQPREDWTRTDSEIIALCGDDAGKWAREFIAMRRSNGRTPLDEGLMISWFANAIESRPKPTLAGEDVDIFDAFGRACAALEAHAEAGQKLNADYRAALEQVSRMAARRNRGR